MSQNSIKERLTIKRCILSPFEELYNENYEAMFRAANKMVGDSDEASDIVQEVFINLFDQLKNGNIIHHPKSLLYRITFNKCVNYLRRQKRYQNIESLRGWETEDEILEKQELKAAINLAISKLKSREKMLAVLYSEGLSYKEIADASGIKFSSIGKMLSRTLKKLERELKNQAYEMH